MKKEPFKISWKKCGGLVPVIIQNAQTNKVLMLGYMNHAALAKTRTTKKAWFYSRTKKRLWMKGEESGNTLCVVSIFNDCDGDTLLIKAIPKGPTCHTGEVSCFDKVELRRDVPPKGGMRVIKKARHASTGCGLKQLMPRQGGAPFSKEAMQALFELIQRRKMTMPKNSYTAFLFKKGLKKICEKIDEESQEVIFAAKKQTKKRLIEEACDLLYHLFVLIVDKRIRLPEIENELKKRRR